MEWQSVDSSDSDFLLWFESCNKIIFGTAILSQNYPDPVMFKQLYFLRNQVIEEAVDQHDRIGDVEPADYQLRTIDSNAQDQSPAYVLQFEGPSCYWLSATVNIVGDGFSIVDTGGFVC